MFLDPKIIQINEFYIVMLKKRSGQLSDFVHKDRDCDVNLYLYLYLYTVIKTQINRRNLEAMKK